MPPPERLSFDVPLTVRGGIRKTLTSLQIPKSVRGDVDLDGTPVAFRVLFGDAVRHVTSKKITSGSELPVPADIARELGRFAAEQPTATVRFEVLLGAQVRAQSFAEQVADALGADASARRARLAKAPKKPAAVLIATWAFTRNPDVVAEVLLRANGRCEECCKPAPFLRRFNGMPYLEVHHVKPLAEDGDDTVENAKALCPNCHRQAHFGPPLGT